MRDRIKIRGWFPGLNLTLGFPAINLSLLRCPLLTISSPNISARSISIFTRRRSSDVASEFNAREFARTLKPAHINSVTIFAKCHHGQCYYPTKTGVQHPALKGRDLLGEQIEALHREGIRCPIYTTVVWEEDVAQKHPEWRQMTKGGTFAGWHTSANQVDIQPGVWKFNNFLDPDYQDYMEAHVREVCANYEVDGLFFDILFFCADRVLEPSVAQIQEPTRLAQG